MGRGYAEAIGVRRIVRDPMVEEDRAPSAGLAEALDPPPHAVRRVAEDPPRRNQLTSFCARRAMTIS